MERINNIENIDKSYIWKDNFGLITKALSKSVGSEKIYVNLDNVPPNRYSTKFHCHSQQEEFFYIISGSGKLRLNDKEVVVKSGDFFAKPASQKNSHTFYNNGTEMLIILDIGTIEKEDTCYYPDENVYLHKSNGANQIFKEESILTDWSSDPNY